SDCWIFERGGVRKIGDRWMIKLLGPGPSAGRWAELSSSGNSGGNSSGDSHSWQWVPHEPENDPFIKEKGAWVFTGTRAPEFHDEQWWFTGSYLSLEFMRDDKSFGAKVRLDEDRVLVIAQDSDQARAMLPLMEQSWNKQLKK